MTKQKKTDDSFPDDFEEVGDEIIRDKVREVFRDNPNNPIEALEEIGFTWYDDNYPSEEDEENSAVPENQNQQDLVEFSQGVEKPSNAILEIFLAEKASDTCPSQKLIRGKYVVIHPLLCSD